MENVDERLKMYGRVKVCDYEKFYGFVEFAKPGVEDLYFSFKEILKSCPWPMRGQFARCNQIIERLGKKPAAGTIYLIEPENIDVSVRQLFGVGNWIRGEIDWFSRQLGHGFILPSPKANVGYSSIILYEKDIRNRENNIKEGYKVRFLIQQTPKGPQATNATIFPN